MFCRNCGTEFEGRFCPKCGEALEQAVSDSNNTTEEKEETLLDKIIEAIIGIVLVILWIRGAHYTSLILFIVAAVVSILSYKLISDRKSVLSYGFQGIACVLALIALGCWYRDYKDIKMVKTGQWDGYSFAIEHAIDYTLDSTSWRYIQEGKTKIVQCNGTTETGNNVCIRFAVNNSGDSASLYSLAINGQEQDPIDARFAWIDLLNTYDNYLSRLQT